MSVLIPILKLGSLFSKNVDVVDFPIGDYVSLRHAASFEIYETTFSLVTCPMNSLAVSYKGGYSGRITLYISNGLPGVARERRLLFEDKLILTSNSVSSSLYRYASPAFNQ